MNVTLYRIDPVESHFLLDSADPRRHRSGAGEADVKGAQIFDGLGRVDTQGRSRLLSNPVIYEM